jgi:hypothetical protein
VAVFHIATNICHFTTAWPKHDLDHPVARKTMIFERNSHVVGDPEQAFRVFWSS